MFDFVRYTSKDLNYTKENIDSYGKELSEEQRVNVVRKYSDLKVSKLNLICRISIIVEILLYVFSVVGIFTAFYFWATYNSSQNNVSIDIGIELESTNQLNSQRIKGLVDSLTSAEVDSIRELNNKKVIQEQQRIREKEKEATKKNRENSIEFWKRFFGLGFLSLLLIHIILVALRYNNYERYIQKEGRDTSEFSKRSITYLGYKMTTRWIDRYENNITGFVYFGAGLLVIVVGLRGLGKNIDKLGFPFPEPLLQNDGLALWVIFAALLIEFLLLVSLATFTFFKDEEEVKKSGTGVAFDVKIDTKIIETLLNENTKAVNTLVELYKDDQNIKNLIRANLITIDAKLNDIVIIKNKVSEMSQDDRAVNSLEGINNKLQGDYLNKILIDFIQLLNKVESKNVVEISGAFEKIQNAVTSISTQIRDDELNQKMNAFNNTLREIKKTLGIASGESESKNEIKPNVN